MQFSTRFRCAAPILAVNIVALHWFAPNASAWSDRGHEIVGDVGQKRLQSHKAQQKVAEILGTEDLKTVSTWADDVKKIKPSELAHPEAITNEAHRKLVKRLNADLDSVAFIKKFNIENAQGKLTDSTAGWHFCDLPVNATGYDDPAVATLIGSSTKPDVVIGINKCIAVLKDDHADIHGAFGKRNALRMLVHLVGDIHQPLHVGCSFINETATAPADLLVKDPASVLAHHLKSDVGGNILFYSDPDELHAFFDDNAVTLAVHAKVPSHHTNDYVANLVGRQSQQSWNSAGSELDWAKSWATDTLKASKKAYTGIVAVDLQKHDHHTAFGTTKGFNITRPATYEADMTSVVDEQLAKGGYRLAKLLDAIWHD